MKLEEIVALSVKHNVCYCSAIYTTVKRPL